MNVLGHAAGAAVPARPDDYRNATLYAQNHLADSILRSNWNYQSGTFAPNQAVHRPHKDPMQPYEQAH